MADQSISKTEAAFKRDQLEILAAQLPARADGCPGEYLRARSLAGVLGGLWVYQDFPERIAGEFRA